MSKIHEKCILAGFHFFELFYCIIFHTIAYSVSETDGGHMEMGIAASQVSGSCSESLIVFLAFCLETSFISLYKFVF